MLVVHVSIVRFVPFSPPLSLLSTLPLRSPTSSPSCLSPRWFHVPGDRGELCPWASSVQQEQDGCFSCVFVCVSVFSLQISSIFEQNNENEDGVIFYSFLRWLSTPLIFVKPGKKIVIDYIKIFFRVGYVKDYTVQKQISKKYQCFQFVLCDLIYGTLLIFKQLGEK